jgi:hypothetical protein
MKNLFGLALISFLLVPLIPSKATHLRVVTQRDTCHMFPANRLRFPVNPGRGQMSIGIWNAVMKKVSSMMAQMPSQVPNARIRILPMWDNSDVNAYATITEVETSPGIMTQQRVIAMFGGLARHPLMTVDGFALVACHEIGHHFGGYPRKGDSFASAEGQADYYGTAKCLRQIFAGENNVQLMARRPVDMTARLRCKNAFPKNQEDAAICMRSAMAGITLAKTLGSLGGPAEVLDLKTPEREVVAETNVSYPSTQCRLDTYFRGALCPEDSRRPMSFQNPNQGACRQRSVFDFGARPVCWFKN